VFPWRPVLQLYLLHALEKRPRSVSEGPVNFAPFQPNATYFATAGRRIWIVEGSEQVQSGVVPVFSAHQRRWLETFRGGRPTVGICLQPWAKRLKRPSPQPI